MTAAAVASARSREKVIEHFTGAKAFTPGSATAYTPGRQDERRAFDTLQRAGVIRSAAPGLYYLDQAALAQERLRWKRRVIVVLAVLALGLGVCVALGVFR